MTRALRFATSALLAAVLFPASGCSLLRDAEISSMVPGGNLMTGTLECWLELTFSGAPDGDPRDVVVEFDSIVMPGPQRVGWDFIAQHDQVRKGDFQGYRLNSDTTPDSAPPLETAIRVKVPLKALDRVQLDMGDDLKLTATLYWGGEKQHSVSRNLGHVYQREGSAL
ncbi:MAG: hypothetical protein JRF70_17565 [Deltaproteobacteria bacterium]|nr:hypothetical protein [Deltaproteobacteria bacterium]